MTLPLGADTHELAAMAQQPAERVGHPAAPVPDVGRRRDGARATSCRSSCSPPSSAIALAAIGDRGRPVVELLDSVAQVMFRFTGYVMRFAPDRRDGGDRGDGRRQGPRRSWSRSGKLVLVMYASLAIFVVLVVGGAALLIRVPFLAFLRTIREPFLIAFTTASSEAALPQVARGDGAVRCAEAHRQLRAADRLQHEPRWQHAVPVGGEPVRRAAGRRRALRRASRS